MIGLLVWKSPGEGKQKRGARTECSVLHMRFPCEEILRGPRTPEAVLRRRVRTAAKRLRRAGVTRLVLPEDFAWTGLVEKCGLSPMPTLPLRQALAADLVRAAAAARGIPLAGAKLAVTGERLTGEIVRTVTELALGSRYVLVDLPSGGEELCRQLRREYGVTLLLSPSSEQLAGAEVLALFCPRPDLAGSGGAVVELYDGASSPLPPLLLPPALELQLPPGVNRPQLLAALREGGVLRPGQITVGALPPGGSAG